MNKPAVSSPPKSHRSTFRSRKAAAQQFNMMVCGHSAAGKTSFLLTLVESLSSKKVIPDDGATAETILPPLSLSAPTPIAARIEFEDDLTAERISLRLIDSPGLNVAALHGQQGSTSDIMNNNSSSSSISGHAQQVADSWASRMIDYIDSQYEASLIEESKVKRNPKSPDYQTHICLYFLDPHLIQSAKGLSPIDHLILRRLCEKVNVVPVIGKADLMTVKQMADLRKWLLEDFKKTGLPIFTFPEDLDDSDAVKSTTDLKDFIPFSIINDELLDPHDLANHEANNVSNLPKTSMLPERPGGGPLGRSYHWGMAEVENEKHCDVLLLRSVIFGSHLEDLKAYTRETLYEKWRTEKLLEIKNSVSAGSTGNASMPVLRSLSISSDTFVQADPIKRKMTVR